MLIAHALIVYCYSLVFFLVFINGSAEEIRNSGKHPKDFIWIPYPYHRYYLLPCFYCVVCVCYVSTIIFLIMCTPWTC